MKQIKGKVGVSYCRVSTLGQVEDELGRRRDDASPEAQRLRCQDHADTISRRTRVQHSIVENLTDIGSAKDTRKRSNYIRMWQMIARHEVDFIIATELTRLSRSVRDFLELVDHCKKHSVDLHIIGLDFDTSSPIGNVLLTILSSLGQFEREMTSQRVRENAATRLLTSGKINGGKEILGLDRDLEKRGHFIPNRQELADVERLLRIFLESSSKATAIRSARSQGITGKRGKELSENCFDYILKNVRWRYRGLWRYNYKNRHIDPDLLPETARFKVVHLPHGPLLDSELLDAVDAKLKDTYDKKKRVAKDEYTYLLSHILTYEDGSRFTGQPGKNRQYRYYFNKTKKIRLTCQDLDQLVVERVKRLILNQPDLPSMIDQSFKKRQAVRPKLEGEIASIKQRINAIAKTDERLRQQLIDSALDGNSTAISWLAEQGEANKAESAKLLQRLEELRAELECLNERPDCTPLKSELKSFVDLFDKASGTEKRNLIEQVVKRVTVCSNQTIQIEFYAEGPTQPPQRNKSTDSDLNGGRTRD